MSAIKYLKNSTAGKLVRPQGFTYPTGLDYFTTGAGPITVDYLVVAGGGSGSGSDWTGAGHGGGGAGGFRTATGFPVTQGDTIAVSVGAGLCQSVHHAPGFDDGRR